MSHRLKGFEPYKGDMEMRQNGSLIAMETGTAYAYAINKLQDRGMFFVSPQDEIYAGQARRREHPLRGYRHQPDQVQEAHQ